MLLRKRIIVSLSLFFYLLSCNVIFAEEIKLPATTHKNSIQGLLYQALQEYSPFYNRTGRAGKRARYIVGQDQVILSDGHISINCYYRKGQYETIITLTRAFADQSLVTDRTLSTQAVLLEALRLYGNKHSIKEISIKTGREGESARTTLLLRAYGFTLQMRSMPKSAMGLPQYGLTILSQRGVEPVEVDFSSLLRIEEAEHSFKGFERIEYPEEIARILLHDNVRKEIDSKVRAARILHPVIMGVIKRKAPPGSEMSYDIIIADQLRRKSSNFVHLLIRHPEPGGEGYVASSIYEWRKIPEHFRYLDVPAEREISTIFLDRTWDLLLKKLSDRLDPSDVRIFELGRTVVDGNTSIYRITLSAQRAEFPTHFETIYIKMQAGAKGVAKRIVQIEHERLDITGKVSAERIDRAHSYLKDLGRIEIPEPDIHLISRRFAAEYMRRVGSKRVTPFEFFNFQKTVERAADAAKLPVEARELLFRDSALLASLFEKHSVRPNLELVARIFSECIRHFPKAR